MDSLIYFAVTKRKIQASVVSRIRRQLSMQDEWEALVLRFGCCLGQPTQERQLIAGSLEKLKKLDIFIFCPQDIVHIYLHMHPKYVGPLFPDEVECLAHPTK